ncbi:MAG: metal-sensitive transcriptional regulator [Alphaproteobacteria bacterium]|nr:metal-sensitive transcriptional regulator [Alphaproteobacteria bacterium]MDD9841186.1 metal-sensitive transcriptional regulator [Alphaproteobacteria bacterium]
MSACHSKNKHPDHSGEMSRLNRILGQIDGVKKMIKERRYCPDIITQLRAINSATKAVERRLLETHLEACVSETFKAKNKKGQQQKIEELIKLFKKFD